jgi:hypothetical protein
MSDKLIRDFVFADGSLMRPGNGYQSRFAACHSISQRQWLLYKLKVFNKLGFKSRLFDYECLGFDNKQSKTLRFYTESCYHLYELYKDWYFFDPSFKKMRKDYAKLLEHSVFDMHSLIVFYLDNGCCATKKSYINYQYGIKSKIDPFIDKFLFSTSYNDPKIFIDPLKRMGIDIIYGYENEKKSFFAITRIEGKLIFKDALRKFCETTGLASTFEYKYDYPLALSQVERLTGRIPDMGPKRSNVGKCDSLICTNNKKKCRGKLEEVSPQ